MMALKPWMVACAGVLITLLALVLQEKLLRKTCTLGEYTKALTFNGLLSYGLGMWLLQWKQVGGGAAILSNGAAAVRGLPADVLSGPPNF